MKGYKIIESLHQTIKSDGFRDSVKLRKQDFIRNRKVGFVDVVSMMMNLMKKSLQLELDDFLDRFKKDVGTYTKQSFSDARHRICPTVFKKLNNQFLNMYYNGDYNTYKNYRLLAIDGSKIQLPNNNETRREFGFIHNNHEHFEIAQALASTLFDVENGIVISSILEHCESSERGLAKKNIEEMLELDKQINNLILFDRGCPSFDFISYLEENNQKYVMRVKNGSFREIFETNSDDEIVTIKITPSRKKHLKQQGIEVEVDASITMRVIKVVLSTGEIETLITNISSEEISHTEMKDLYFKRWGIETKYDELKNKFEIENFSGKSIIAVKQDFHAVAFLANIASVIAEDAMSIYNAKDNSKKNISTK